MAHVASWYWDKGLFRETNEDSFSLQRVRAKGKEIALLLVCDGIGGLPEGETASGFVAERLTEWFFREGIRLAGGLQWRKRTVQAVLAEWERVQADLELCEREEEICCGTTCTMAVVKEGGFVILHSGDSRAFLIGKKQRQLTQDHREQNALRRCVGAFRFLPPDVICGRMAKGEMLLLCTDGFCNCMPPGFLKGCLSEEGTEKESCYKRLKGAGSFVKTQGEKDNLTALLLCFGREEGGR